MSKEVGLLGYTDVNNRRAICENGAVYKRNYWVEVING